MAVNVKIYSRLQIAKETNFKDSTIDQYSSDYFICINATGMLHSIPHFKKDHERVLNLYFDDTEVDKEKWLGPIKYTARACTRVQALQIVKFIDNIPDQSIVHIYCTRGESRSPAIGFFIREYKNKETNVEKSSYINYFLYNLLHEVSKENVC